MLDRRRALQVGLITLGLLFIAAPLDAFAQAKPPVKVRYAEVVRSILYAPAYVAIANGYFKDAGLDVAMTTAQGGDKTVAALLTNSADIALIGPETSIYVQNGDSPTKIPIFCGLTVTDGFMLIGREKADKFDWQRLKGKQILALRPGSTPDLFLEAALRQNGIDPFKDVKLVNNIAIPARVGSWLAGQNQYAIFMDPDAAQLEMDGKGYVLASIGQTVGPAATRPSWRPTNTSARILMSSRAGPTRSTGRRNGQRRRNRRRLRKPSSSSSPASARRPSLRAPNAIASSRCGRRRRRSTRKQSTGSRTSWSKATCSIRQSA